MKQKWVGLLVFLLLMPLNGQARYVNEENGQTVESKTWSWNSVKAAVTNWWGNLSQKIQPSPAGSQLEKPAVSQPSQSLLIAQQTKQEILKTKAEFKAATPVKVSQPGKAFSGPLLILGRNNVPVFEFIKLRQRVIKTGTKKIPELDVGMEPTLAVEDLLVKKWTQIPQISEKKVEVLATPNLEKQTELDQAMLAQVPAPQSPEAIPVPVLTEAQKVTGEKVNKISYQFGAERPITEMAIVQFTPEELKLLRGLILVQKKDQCHVATGIFVDLIGSENQEVKDTSRFNLGVCLYEMHLPTEGLKYLSQIIKSKNRELAPEAISTIVKEVPLFHEDDVADALQQGHADQLIPKTVLNDAAYLIAKNLVRKRRMNEVASWVQKIDQKAQRYPYGQFLLAIAEYEQNQPERAITRLKELSVDLATKGINKDLQGLVNLNLGRIAFQKAKYRDSVEAFQRVPKSHPLWMQGLTELAWAQLQSKDAAGAIGNMHSIQSPYFDAVWKPESYIVRSIGYLDICQYADAAKSLGYLKFRYEPWISKADAFLANQSSDKLYEEVVHYLKTRGKERAPQLPSQIILDIAHQRNFLNAQENLNLIVDEIQGYPFIKQLVEKDKSSLAYRKNTALMRIGYLEKKIGSSKAIPGLAKNIPAWQGEINQHKNFLSVFQFKVDTLKEAQDGLGRLQSMAQKSLNEKKAEFRAVAGKVLKANLSKLASRLKKNLENNELVMYEILAGSGENIRYQMAGGKTGAKQAVRAPAGQKWEFEGEFWEDEIG
ncbi:MAG: hypothetical protein IT289_09415, partial [Oligoflexia bacterium]|nr:hypothetical protein [Oligoflexia bacterium]